MADTVEVKWIYPQNWDGFFEDNTGFRRMKVRLSGVSDGTGETDVAKVVRADLMTHNHNIPSKIVVEDISWVIHGLTAVLEWDFDSSDEVIMRFNGGVAAGTTEGHTCFKKQGGLIPNDDAGTGDIILTTTNCNSGDTYDITVGLRLKD